METIDRNGGSTLWHQIGEILAADIAAGTFAPGARLPTEPELMERFGVSRFTVRQALGHLEQRGLVRAEQRLLPGIEQSSLSNGGVVCTPARLHGELPPGSIRS